MVTIRPSGRLTDMPPSAEPLRDGYGRQMTYLRISVTEKCNLRCFYCLPHDCSNSARADELDLGELAEVVQVGVTLGISKIRITGGEPLVRRGLVDFIRTLRSMAGVADLALSTNGTLLAEHATALASAGLMRVNVSLDSLQPAVFRTISGRSDLERVVAGIGAARAAGLHPVKLNVVVMRGVNDNELPAMLDFASEHGAQARFIEYMPLGMGKRWESSYISRAEILDRLGPRLAMLAPRQEPGDAATYYPLRAGGEVGVISPVSCRFCDRCNRLRLTADGKLRPCLTSEGEVDLCHALRPEVLPHAIADCFRAATASRQQHGTYQTEEADRATGAARPMAAIGG